ncbi:hypothetical protein D3C85_832030 [compost metagenome]
MVQLNRRQVDRHAQVDEALIVPFAQLLAGLIQHPFANGDDRAVLLCQRDEQVRRHQTVFRMLPANQRFDADHAVIAIADLRLINQIELIAQQCIAQVFFQLATAAHLAVDAGDIELITVARAGLGQGHGLLGLLQQLLGAVAVLREQGDANGRAQADFLMVEGERRLQIIKDALRQFGRFVRLLDIRLYQCELVAAETGEGAEATAVGAQTIGQGQQQLVAGLVAELLVDTFEIIQPHAQHRDPALQLAGVDQNLVQLLLELLAIRQAGEEVVLGHAQQTVFRFMTQMSVAFDRLEQLIGGVDPDPQLVFFVALELRNLVFAGAIGVDLGEVFDDSRQRLGQQPVIDQIQHQAHRQCAQHPGNKDDHRTDDKALAIGGGVEGDAQVAVVLAVRTTPYQLRGEGAFLAENQVGQPAAVGLLQFAGFLREHGFVGMADRGLTHGIVLEQAFDHLHAHFPVEAVNRLGRGIAEHVEDAFGVAGNGLAGFVSIENDLCAAQDYADDQCRQEHDPEQLHRQAVLEFQLQRVIPCSVRVASSCHEYWQSRVGSQRDNQAGDDLPVVSSEMLLSGVLALICTMSVVSPLNLSGSQHFFLFLMLARSGTAASGLRLHFLFDRSHAPRGNASRDALPPGTLCVQ